MNNELERRAVAMEFLRAAARLGQPGTKIFMNDTASPLTTGVRYVTVEIEWYDEPSIQILVLN